MRRVKELIRNRSRSLDFTRVYIPKDSDSYRPLGVPSVEWRVYLHMFNNLLVFFRFPREGQIQHGYLTGRGVITAWKRLLLLVEKPDLYEFDLKGFFDRVSLPAINEELRAMLVPEDIIDFVWSINLKQPSGIDYSSAKGAQST